MDNSAIARIKIKKATISEIHDANDELAIEEPLEIQITTGANNHKTISVTMRTPGNDEELAVGFLFTEGIVKNIKQLARTQISSHENKALIILKENENFNLQNTERNFYTTSSCGVCGKTSIEAIKTISNYTNIEDNIRVPVARLLQLEKKLKQQQAVFETTGGLHASALFDLQGKFIMLREDVGRHNALDK